MAHIRAGWVKPCAERAPKLNPGPADRPWLFKQLFAVDRVWQRLITHKIDLNPFIVDENEGPLSLNRSVTIGRHQLAMSVLLLHDVNDVSIQDTVILADILGAEISDTYTLPQELARDYFKQIILAHFGDVTRQGEVPAHSRLAAWFYLTQEDWVTIKADAPFTGRNVTRQGLPDQYPPTMDQLNALTLQQLGQLWYILSSYPTDNFRGERFHTRMTTLLLTLLVAVAKQGCVSDQYVRKIADGMQAYLGRAIDIDREVCKLFYQRYGHGINDTNIQHLLNRWIAFLPDATIRMTLTLIQASGGGLTCFITIGRAFKLFPTFNWTEVFGILPADIEKFRQAVLLVGDNPWYGFKKDLGPARSTNFKNLGWVAKELLVKGKGETALNQYRGWPQRIPQMDKVRWLINKYLHIPMQDEDAFGGYDRPIEIEVPDDVYQLVLANTTVFT